MIAHIMQALIVVILIAFPFAINFNGISLDNHSLNSTAVVDSAIVKHYAQNGSLPEKLDAETLKKLGLDADDIKGMTYKKLEDRKFVLSYADSKDKVNESIHSNTKLPVNVNTNFGQVESKEDTFWLELPESPNQTVTVEIKFPDGSTTVLNEGEKKQYPANSEFNVVIVPDKGFGPGKGLPSNGLLNKDMVLEVTDAEINKIKITINKPNPIPPEGEEALYFFYNIQANTPRWSWESEDEFIPLGIGETYVPFGSEIRGGALLPEWPQIYQVEANPINFIAENDTVINLEVTKRLGYIVNVDNTPNQTIKVTVDTTNQLPWKDLYRKGEVLNQFQIWNGESCIVPRQGCEIFKVEVVADAGYKPGTPSVTSCPITGDMTVTATPAVKEEPPVEAKDTWIPIKLKYYDPGKPAHGTPVDEYYSWGNFYDVVGIGNHTSQKYILKIPKGISRIAVGYPQVQVSAGEAPFIIEVIHPSYSSYSGNGNFNRYHYERWGGVSISDSKIYTRKKEDICLNLCYKDKIFSQLPHEEHGFNYPPITMYNLFQVVPDSLYIISIPIPYYGGWASSAFIGFFYNPKHQDMEVPFIDLTADYPANEIPDSMK